jgi:pyruvate ferredoxin oxidoreductase delta subunit
VTIRQSGTPKWRELALGNAVLVPGSSRLNRTGDWRSSRPVWKLEQCVKCGVCTLFCPEGCIAMRKADAYPEADMEYCKGCGICVNECFTGCIAMQEEKE